MRAKHATLKIGKFTLLVSFPIVIWNSLLGKFNRRQKSEKKISCGELLEKFHVLLASGFLLITVVRCGQHGEVSNKF
jgi:hypothetical protein